MIILDSGQRNIWEQAVMYTDITYYEGLLLFWGFFWFVHVIVYLISSFINNVVLSLF